MAHGLEMVFSKTDRSSVLLHVKKKTRHDVKGLTDRVDNRKNSVASSSEDRVYVGGRT